MTARARPVDGVWEGTLAVSGADVRIMLRVATTSDGSLHATVDIPDQGATNLKVDSIELGPADVARFVMRALSVAFQGTRDATGTSISGEFTQAGAVIPLVLRWQAVARAPARPQEPRQPYPYRTEDVSYENTPGGVTLAGTLTIPGGTGTFPAALLITGSGAQDRDEALFGHKPFLVLADHLTRIGIAVLRVDDRGVGGSTGDTQTSTSEDLAGDVETGVAFLRSRAEVDPAQIGLIGHSEGGIIAPMVAARSADIAYIVMLAGPGLPGAEILLLQGALIAKAGGASDDQIDANRDLQQRIFEVLRSEPDPRAAEAKVRVTITQGLTHLARLSGAPVPTDEALAAQVEAQLRAVLSPWFRFFLTHDPRPVLSRVRCPVLAIDGERDLQVPPRENLAAIEEALTTGGNTRVTVKELPGLNHLFQTCETGHPSEYAQIEETIAPIALELIGSWIRGTLGSV